MLETKIIVFIIEFCIFVIKIEFGISDECEAGNRQSPIALNNSFCQTTTPHCSLRYQFVDDQHCEKSEEMDLPAYVTNNGITVKLKYPRDEFIPVVESGPLKEGKCYLFNQMHFHWGEDENSGSEHSLNKRKYAMEAHLVHVNADYKKKEFYNHRDGLAVIAFFLEANDTTCDNDALEPLTSILKKVVKPGKDEQIDIYPIMKLFVNTLLTHGFYTYNGSLTTPPFSEIVTWIVCPHPIPISKQQVEEFRKIKDRKRHQIHSNVRELQPLNDRRILFYPPPAADNSNLAYGSQRLRKADNRMCSLLRHDPRLISV